MALLRFGSAGEADAAPGSAQEIALVDSLHPHAADSTLASLRVSGLASFRVIGQLREP
jgi:hypothetical protein